MFKSIKWKIFFGFLVLAFMLFVAGSITIFEFVSLTRTVNAILDNNYKMMQSATSMLEALEREDSGILLYLSGNQESGMGLVSQGDSSFYTAYNEAVRHIYTDTDRMLLKRIQVNYSGYKSYFSGNALDSIQGPKMTWYSNTIYPVFVEVKSAIKSVMIHNQDIIYQETTRLKDKSRRAIMPGIVAILSSLLMTVIFTYLINKFFVRPIIDLTKKVENYKTTNGPIDADIITHDELKQLEEAIQDLVYRLKRK